MGVNLDDGSWGGRDIDDNSKEEVVEKDDNDKTVALSGGIGRHRGPPMTRRMIEEPLREQMQPPSH